jgi:hypothetical protein
MGHRYTSGGSLGTAEKIRENRLRNAAHRQGLKLSKSRRRDPRAQDYGYMLIDPTTNTPVVWGSPRLYGLSLDEIERALNE